MLLCRLGLLATAGLLLAGCADASAPPASPSEAKEHELTVFAAASLSTTFTELGRQFEAAHPGTTVTFSFAGSSDLAAQILQGAPADVFAAADQKNMAKVGDAGLTAGEPVAFATNVLEIATAPGNPEGITSLADLARPGLDVVVCAEQVPCGAATTKVEEAAGIDLTPVSEENSVTDVLARVTSGEADAGLVYVTDVTAAGSAVTGVPFPESARAVNTYPVATLKDSAEADLGREFVRYVTSPEGRGVLRAAGFGAPPS
ncbi:molybdate ABC transporter substrate-binding protein [Kineococcus gynurae]|uniref:Molybdate ABC transporter substrate-binding protein n=1 Tax=Kineococcus gynurae TaxID=452979 RepID=A0ABV5LR46_9ACTN